MISRWILVFTAPVAFAQVDRSVIKEKAKHPAFDLIKESESIPVMREETVQIENKRSRHVYAASLGQMTAQSLTLTSNGYQMAYDLTKAAPFFGAQMGYYPLRWNGYLGLMGSIGYSMREVIAPTASAALHLIANDILLSYRIEISDRAWFKPYFGIGGGVNIVFQRGIDEVNTSEAHGVGVGVLGLGLNMQRLFKSSSLDWELGVQWKRWIDPQVSNVNYNGNVISLGMAMVL